MPSISKSKPNDLTDSNNSLSSVTKSVKKHKSSKNVEFKPDVNFITGKPYSDHYYELLEVRQRLPAYKSNNDIVKHFLENQTLIIIGSTGSGKTTQCPQFFLEQVLHLGKKVAVTQPRRLAAISTATRVAEECDVQLGQHVGYKIRFEDVTSSLTSLVYMTDGMLLRELQEDSTLSNYSVVIIDEAHERTLDTDILLGSLKCILRTRKDLKVVIMSASLCYEKFVKFFSAVPFFISGISYPVEVVYSPTPVDNYVDAAITQCVSIHAQKKQGDILVFLTGEEEIEKASEALRNRLSKMDKVEYGPTKVYVLYSMLSPSAQKHIFDEAPSAVCAGGMTGRKFILSTNIAETSLTIDKIVYVIDCGFSKVKFYDPKTRREALVTTPISKANAIQRTGRAGRTQPGFCYRLYTEESFKALPDYPYPEILRCNVHKVILFLLKLNLENIVRFPYLEAPSPETVMRALEELHSLKAINDKGKLTAFGDSIVAIPLDPFLASLLLKSYEFNVVNEVTLLCAMLSCGSPFLAENQLACKLTLRQFRNDVSDHLTLVNILNSYIENHKTANWAYNNYLNEKVLANALKIYQQLKNFKFKNVSPANEQYTNTKFQVRFLKCLTSVFFQSLAFRSSNKTYKQINTNTEVQIHPSSLIINKPELVIFHAVVTTNKTYLRVVSEISSNWLREINPEYHANLLQSAKDARLISLLS